LRVNVPPAVLEIVRTLEDAGFEAWCVGGALRDFALGAPASDMDVATSAPPERVRKLFRRTVPVGERFGTVGVLDRSGDLHEVTTFRRDVTTDGRHAVVAFGASLEEDLARRDFTVNALAYHPLRDEWRDPFGGARDINARVIRAVGRAEERFREDYLRILRGLRFAARFGFEVEPGTWAAMQAAAPGLERISAERVRDEWFKGLTTAQEVSHLVRLWRESGAASVWLPALGDAAPSEPAVSRVPRDPILLTILLVADGAASLRRLRASNAEIGRAERAAGAPPAPAGSTAADIRRWLAAAGPAADDLIALAELRDGRMPPWEAAVQAARVAGVPLSRGHLAIRGDDLTALGLRGPEVGRVLDVLLTKVLEDPALNERERLLALVREVT
jgi:tRNA nucleotidyltransferase (CCA-adding enzyme)